MKTFTATPKDIQHRWFLIDADGMVLGRLASEVAKIIRGKHKPIFTPHMDTGDHVIVINASRCVSPVERRSRSAISGTAATWDMRASRHTRP
jgi:ribosomal protein L13